MENSQYASSCVCPHCGETIPLPFIHCPYCGRVTGEALIYSKCPRCNNQVVSRLYGNCSHCGENLLHAFVRASINDVSSTTCPHCGAQVLPGIYCRYCGGAMYEIPTIANQSTYTPGPNLKKPKSGTSEGLKIDGKEAMLAARLLFRIFGGDFFDGGN